MTDPSPARRRVAAVLVALACGGLTAPPATADDVSRRGDAPAVRGAVTAGDRAGVTVQPPGDPEERVPAAEIADVSWDGEPPTLGRSRNREARGDLEVALTDYRAAAPELAKIGPLARGDGQFLIARALGKLALNDPARRAEAAETLGQFVTENPDHFRLDPALRLLADVQAAAGDLEAAAATLEKLKQSPSPQFQTEAAVAEGEIALRGNDPAAALAAFDAVLQSSGDAGAGGRAAARARVGRAAALGRQGNHAEALEALDAVLDAADAGDAELRAMAHVRRGDSLQATGETMPAVLEYLKVDVLYPGAGSAHAESLYHLSRLWATAGRPERAAEAAAKLKTNYPNSDWAAKLSAG